MIAGLAAVTVVVEARERSGALITADFALEQGRDVMAVPGEITSATSAGANGLLRQGAAPVTRVADVLEALGLEVAPPRSATPTGEAALVLAALTRGPQDVDGLARETGLSAGVVASLLAALELDGHVSGDDGVYRTTMPP